MANTGGVAGWWGNRTNLLNEIVEGEGKGAVVRFDEIEIYLRSLFLRRQV